MNYKKELEKFLEKESNREYSAKILYKLTSQMTVGEIAEIKKSSSNFVDNIEKTISIIVKRAYEKGYSASFIPTVISFDNAPNFYIGKEYNPTDIEIYRFLYLLLTGLYSGNYIFNIDNISRSTLDDFREYLINEKLMIFSFKDRNGIDDKKLRREIKYKIPYTEFAFTILMLFKFCNWIKYITHKNTGYKEKLEELGLQSFLEEEIGVGDDATLVIFNIELRGKRSMYFFPRMTSLISRWFSEYILNHKKELPSIIRFIFSTYVSGKKYGDKSRSLIDKFLFYFLNGYVNGEIIDNMITMKISYELSKKRGERIYGIHEAGEFFRRL